MTNISIDAKLTAGTTYRWDLVAVTAEGIDYHTGSAVGPSMWGYYTAAPGDTGHTAKAAATHLAAHQLGKTVHAVQAHRFTLSKQ